MQNAIPVACGHSRLPTSPFGKLRALSPSMGGSPTSCRAGAGRQLVARLPLIRTAHL
jgi:hypothetical protein